MMVASLLGATATAPAPTPDQILDAVPTSAEIAWDARPGDPIAIECPQAWQSESIAAELVDQECARLIANALYEPPITEAEIDKYARHFQMSRRQAELEIRKGRKDADGR